ncbi:MAG: transcriptional repressor [Prevotella sp.]|nr:transcriptional repressor [Bacteroides sp.]MCM1366331.1 transcriptional repressor [Prevotella sp.]MCM1436311.1 transcriptional repressor [Prevotella sp.]
MTLEDRRKRLHQKFYTFLRDRGKRVTLERSKIVEKALGIDGHFDVDDLYKMLESEGFHVSLTTVYTTLELMYGAGILRKHSFEGQQTRFEIIGDNHFHLVCLHCGKMEEIRDVDLFSRQGKFRVPGFTVNYFTATLYGVCDTCLRRNRRIRKEIAEKRTKEK